MGYMVKVVYWDERLLEYDIDIIDMYDTKEEALEVYDSTELNDDLTTAYVVDGKDHDWLAYKWLNLNGEIEETRWDI